MSAMVATTAPQIVPAYLRAKDAAKYLGISPSFLAKVARKGEGPKRRLVGRAVLYAVKDLDEFMERAAA